MEIMTIDIMYHSYHDGLLEMGGYPTYCEPCSCLEFQAHDGFLIDELLAKPHYGIACEVLGL